MKIETMILAVAVALGAARAVGGPGSLDSGRTNVCDTNLVHADLSRPLTKYDADQDGTITSEEALAIHQAIVDGKINSLLETYDLNGDGEITDAEINTVHQRKYGGRHVGFRR